MNPLHELRAAGQSPWLDSLSRGMIPDALTRLTTEDAVGGVTSNPSIFRKAIEGNDYDAALRALAAKDGRSPLELFYDLALADIQMAADALRPVYDRTDGADGFVSFELEPRLARDTAGSIRAARDLFAQLGKPNVMIKVPGTPEGADALVDLIAAGVNVNVTLLFAVSAYERVMESYISGLERRLAAGEPIDRVASVASFFVSRVDTAVDPHLPASQRGTIAIANAKVAYQRFLALFSGPRWQTLAAAGARVQRPLWASTGTKNPAYSDVLYVESLIGRDTVNTMPEATLDAFRDHGTVRPDTILEGADDAAAALASLSEHGVDLDAVTDGLLEAGITAFDDDLQALLATIDAKIAQIRGDDPSP
jgi:transaldolase